MTAPETPQNETSAEGSQEPRGVQDRINQLTRQRREAERSAEAAEARASTLESKLEALQAQVESLARPQPAQPAGKDPFADLLGTSGKAASVDSSSPPLDNLVKKAVQEALAPLVEQQQAYAQVESLRREQQSSFNEAAHDLPSIKVAGSAEQQLFDQIWSARPELQAIPEGPAMVIQMVKGVLADASASGLDARKQAATPPAKTSVPQQRLSNIPGDQDRTAARVADIQDRIKRNKAGDPTVTPVSDQEINFLIGARMGLLREE